MNELFAGTKIQLRLFRRNPGHLMVFTTIPFFSAIFLSSLNAADRTDLAPYAVIAPTLMALWLVSLDLMRLGHRPRPRRRQAGTLHRVAA